MGAAKLNSAAITTDIPRPITATAIIPDADPPDSIYEVESCDRAPSARRVLANRPRKQADLKSHELREPPKENIRP